MVAETRICQLLSDLLPNGRLNACFEADAELVPWASGHFLFSTDEFSGEDLFCEDDPRAPGWNIVAGTLSDIVACGGTPQFYAHALTIGPVWDEPYLREFGEGVREALLASGTRFMGGDSGRAQHWRCTGTVIGSPGERVVTRRGAAAGDALYLSGAIGSGNLQAAYTMGMLRREAHSAGPRFALRTGLAPLIAHFAGACLDTSDGLSSALTTLADLNGCGFAVDAIPFAAEPAARLEGAGLPRVLLALGGCGEYELLFTVRRDREASFRSSLGDLEDCPISRIGEITASCRKLRDRTTEFDVAQICLHPRDFDTPAQYLSSLIHRLRANTPADAAGRST